MYDVDACSVNRHFPFVHQTQNKKADNTLFCRAVGMTLILDYLIHGIVLLLLLCTATTISLATTAFIGCMHNHRQYPLFVPVLVPTGKMAENPSLSNFEPVFDVLEHLF